MFTGQFSESQEMLITGYLVEQFTGVTGHHLTISAEAIKLSRLWKFCDCWADLLAVGEKPESCTPSTIYQWSFSSKMQTPQEKPHIFLLPRVHPQQCYPFSKSVPPTFHLLYEEGEERVHPPTLHTSLSNGNCNLLLTPGP